MAQHQPNITSVSDAPHGSITNDPTHKAQSVNRKKQKRRAKAAVAASMHTQPSPNGTVSRTSSDGKRRSPACVRHHHHSKDAVAMPGGYNTADAHYSDDDRDQDQDELRAYNTTAQNGIGHSYCRDPVPVSHHRHTKRPRGTSRNTSYRPDHSEMLNTAMSNLHLPTAPPRDPVPNTALRSISRSAKNDRIWNTSTQEERERIKEFWLSLSEEERKSLLKIEKDAVLRKMKEQQKHSCSCTVCGRKRTAIEEELEVLYDAYYDELEQYANIQHQPTLTSASQPLPPPPPRAPYANPAHYPPPLNSSSQHQHLTHRTSRIREVLEPSAQDPAVDQYDDPDEDEIYSDEYDSDAYEDDPYETMPEGIGSGFFDFGNSLTVKGGILTVADDLLKNDGRKFIEMMEQLAERRMQREQDAEYAATQPTHHAPPLELPLEDEEVYDEDEDYDSQEEYDQDYEVDEMGGLTEEQRMEEGRRMFQIFAARMFEQRVLTAYREKVAAERQRKLLEELEDEDRQDAQRKDKKQKDAEKKKNKKQAQKQAKAEAQAKKEADRAAEEAALKSEAAAAQEQLREKKEAQRKEAQARKKALDDERQRKEEYKQQKLKEDKERQELANVKAKQLKEQKVLEKKQREEKEREEKENKEREAREVQAREAEARQLDTAKAVLTEPTQQNAPKSSHEQPTQILQAPSMVTSQSQSYPQPSAGPAAIRHAPNIASPHFAIATPAIPKIGPANRTKLSSQRESGLSSPTASVALGRSQTASPNVLNENPANLTQFSTQSLQHATVGTIKGSHQPNQYIINSSVAPPAPHAHGIPSASMQTFHGQGQLSHSAVTSQSTHSHRMLAQHSAQGVHSSVIMPPAPGFTPDVGTGAFPAAPIGVPPSHMRHHSASDKVDSLAPGNTLLRPAPIQRPLGVVQNEHSHERQQQRTQAASIDDANTHWGSSALLDDADEPLPRMDARKFSNPPGMGRSAPIGFSAPLFTSMPGQSSFSGNQSNWSSPNGYTPVTGSLGTPIWGNALGGGGGNNAWPANSTFGATPRHPHTSRPLAVRLAVCQACRQLSQGNPEAYHDTNMLLRQIDANGSLPDGPPTLKEIEEICETEGDAQNGGGLLSFQRVGGKSFAVTFEPGQSAPGVGRPLPGQLGEIGSPVSPQNQGAQRGLGKLGAELTPTGGF